MNNKRNSKVSKESVFEHHLQLVSNGKKIKLRTTKPKKDSKTSIRTMQLFKCINSDCRYYKSRHRRYYWFSKTKITKPSCPKCFSHKTAKVTSEEAKKLGI